MKKSILSLMALTAASGAYAKQVMLMPMEVNNNKITETVSGQTYDVQGLFAAENTVGAKGNALRFDGYTTQINADLPALDITRNMTVALWVAAQTYPIIEMDKETTEKVALASCLDEGAMKGFGFYMGFDGSITFRCYVGSRGILLNSSKKLTLGDWNSLVATVSPDTGTATLGQVRTDAVDHTPLGDHDFHILYLRACRLLITKIGQQICVFGGNQHKPILISKTGKVSLIAPVGDDRRIKTTLRQRSLK